MTVKLLTDGSHISPDYGDEITAGRVVGMSQVIKFGRNVDIDTSAEDIWDGGGDYPFPTTASKLSLSSTSAFDTATATGARTVKVEGLDGNYVSQIETVTMTGTSLASTAGTYLRTFRVRVLTAGTHATAIGTITAIHQTASATQAKITIGKNQTLMAIYTIPAGKVGQIKKYCGSINARTSARGDMELYFRPKGGVFNLKHNWVLDPDFQHFFDYAPLTATAQTDIKLRASTSANDIDVSGGFTIRLEDL